MKHSAPLLAAVGILAACVAPPAAPHAAAVAPPPKVAPEERASPFAVVARGPHDGVELSIGRFVRRDAEPLLVLAEQLPFAKVDRGKMEWAPELLRGYPLGRAAHFIGGRLPDGAFVSTREGSGRIQDDEGAYRWSGDHWTHEGGRPRMSRAAIRATTPWTNGRLLGLVHLFDYGGSGHELAAGGRRADLEVLAGPKDGAVPRLPDDACPSSVAARANGEVFVVSHCHEEPFRLRRYRAGDAIGADEPLPVTLDPYARVHLTRIGADVYLEGARARDRGWEVLERDARPVAEDASVWQTKDNTLFRRGDAGAREELPLPKGFALDDAWALSAKDVWALARGEREAAILHTGARAEPPLAFPTRDATLQRFDDLEQPVRYSERCATPLLMLAGHGVVDVHAQDFRDVCKALDTIPTLAGSPWTLSEVTTRGVPGLAMSGPKQVPFGDIGVIPASKALAASYAPGAELVCRVAVPKRRYILECGAKPRAREVPCCGPEPL